jgi:hypothetical protein
LTRKIARGQLQKGFGEPQWAPKPFPSQSSLRQHKLLDLSLLCGFAET